ncbi:MAG: hypothetical protein ACTSRG_02220 [Candidatus Helarchaeota archaeon]
MGSERSAKIIKLSHSKISEIVDVVNSENDKRRIRWRCSLC